ncbi:MAG: hypothetical protein CBC24_04780 [Candidatus Pelagibacter sp. TMED64]|nr:hypothetical protein [Candidatus Pelagibacter sp.]OUU65725.1 MAG: hypothetical protein CBC24_04780 [Candidatus Pelagibacter sp. TMED64]|tara:strand:- start:3154 stop:3336 length:183 start_codon:yes stop_codon:yes gene_type:complete
MKITGIRAMIIASIIIILLYILGLFLPIILTSKTTSLFQKDQKNNLFFTEKFYTKDRTNI